jgi:hypothetical protein
LVTARRLRAEGKLRRVDWALGGGFEKRQNPANPMVGSVLQYTRGSLEEQTVEVVQNHEGGTRSGGGSPFPKEVTTWLSGVDSREKPPDGRAIFEGFEWWCGEVDRKRSAGRRGGKPHSTIGRGGSQSRATRP